MPMSTLGTLSFLAQPDHGKEFGLAVYINPKVIQGALGWHVRALQCDKEDIKRTAIA